MTIRFGRSICNYLSTAESREWLVTNGIGGYACGTISGQLTRHYHGLLVAALHPPVGRTLLVTRLEETVDYRNQQTPLFTNRWAGGELIPAGYPYIESFQLEGAIPCWRYAIQDAVLSKRIWMQQGENTTYSCYTVHRCSAPLHLALKAVVNYRDHHGGYTDGDWVVKPHANGISVRANPQTVPFYLLSSDGDVTRCSEWFHDYDLAIEQYRGTGDRDSHLHAATITVTLHEGDRLLIAVSTSPNPCLDAERTLGDRRRYEEEILDHWDRTDTVHVHGSPAWIRQLALAADQFIVNRPVENEPDGKTVIAGYPWFGDWGRDTMISLPGLTVATGRPKLARPILRTFGKYLSQGMLPNLFPESGQKPEYNTVDAILWYFEAIRAYVDATHDIELIQDLYPALVDVINWHRNGTRYRIQLDPDDGLIYAGEAGVQLTWMDAKVGDWVVTPRIGKPIEINALWHNALLIMERFAQWLGKPSDDYQHLAYRCRQGFQRFWMATAGYCYDVLDAPEGNDVALR
ncbi:MAG: amylo-alpha-1,6-glucosidase, partial [Cyanobacteria bacterium J06626_14]